MSPAANGDPGTGAGRRTYVRVGPEAIDPAALQRRAVRPEGGAVVQFCGTVRNHNREARVRTLAYEAYVAMAESALAEIVSAAAERWDLLSAAVVHRTGPLEISEVSVCVTVSAPHRGQAFAACRDIVERLKRRVPIWKRETLESGERRWVEGDPPVADRPAE